MIHQREHTSLQMYFTADSPALASEDSFVSESNSKPFDNLNSDLYDMDSELSYQEIFHNVPDQAVPDFMAVNTPVSTAGYPMVSSASMYAPEFMMGGEMPTDKLYTSQEPPSYYGSYHVSTAWNSTPCMSHVPVQPTAIEQPSSVVRGPVIMQSTTPEQKPRRKGGRKPKNDPLPPHLEERRRLRRVRNKEAAQKCRERRLAHTDQLLKDIDELERQTSQYEAYINKLREFKEQCEFVLNSHRNNCNKNSKRTLVTGRPFSQLNLSCSADFRRSSSSDGDLQSPSLIL